MPENISATAPWQQPLQRRTFLQVSGAAAAAAALALAGCSDSDDGGTTPTNPNELVLPSGDVGLVNYLFLLEQLEEALYTSLVNTPPADFSPAEKAQFQVLHDHEIVHRETLRYILGGNALPLLTFDFSSLTLTTRAGALAAAQRFEDLGVAAYAGVLPLLSDATLQALLLKISSVEGRHAALLRDLLVPGSFAAADVVSSLSGQTLALTPSEVVAATAAFTAPYTVSVVNLPTV